MDSPWRFGVSGEAQLTGRSREGWGEAEAP